MSEGRRSPASAEPGRGVVGRDSDTNSRRVGSTTLDARFQIENGIDFDYK